MSAATYLIGDVFDVLATMPDDSVDLVLTSPPFEYAANAAAAADRGVTDGDRNEGDEE